MSQVLNTNESKRPTPWVHFELLNGWRAEPMFVQPSYRINEDDSISFAGIAHPPTYPPANGEWHVLPPVAKLPESLRRYYGSVDILRTSLYPNADNSMQELWSIDNEGYVCCSVKAPQRTLP